MANHSQASKMMISKFMVIVLSALVVVSVWVSRISTNGNVLGDDLSIQHSASDWETKPLPIMKSLSKGFRPVYIYSKVAPPEDSMKFSQERQDEVILALTKMNDEIQDLKPIRRPFFVDLAANDALTLSNTFLLEKNGEFAQSDRVRPYPTLFHCEILIRP